MISLLIRDLNMIAVLGSGKVKFNSSLVCLNVFPSPVIIDLSLFFFCPFPSLFVDQDSYVCTVASVIDPLTLHFYQDS
eukprot:15602398-Heterocapsa_arctica.AAC.1